MRKTFIKYIKRHGHPFATLVAHQRKDGVFNIGLSVCSKHDKFNKKTGKSIAILRAEKEQRVYFATEKDINVVDKELLIFTRKIAKNYRVNFRPIVVLKHKYGKGKYPYIGRYDYKKQFGNHENVLQQKTDFRVLFLSKDYGIALENSKDNLIKRYMIRDDWDESFFDLEVEIKND